MRARASQAGHLPCLVLSAVMGLAASATTAPANLAYLHWTQDRPDVVSVSLSGDLSKAIGLGESTNWRIRSLDLTTREAIVVRPLRVDVLARNQQVNLVLPRPLEPWRDAVDLTDVVVTYFAADDYQELRLRRGASQLPARGTPAPRGYRAARGKDDADVYLSGTFVAAHGSRPSFAADVKLRHEILSPAGGSLKAAFDLAAANEPNLDPDSIKGSLSYDRVFAASAIVLRWALVTGEFARKDDLVNLTSSARVMWAPRSLPLASRTYLALEPFGGFDLGRKLSRRPAGTDETVARPFFGANAYVLALAPGAGLDRITLGTEFTLRLPQTDEPYTERREGQTLASLTQRARPHLRVDLALQFKAGFGFSVQYRHGSEPPAFARVEHRLALGFTVQLQRPKS